MCPSWFRVCTGRPSDPRRCRLGSPLLTGERWGPAQDLALAQDLVLAVPDGEVGSADAVASQDLPVVLADSAAADWVEAARGGAVWDAEIPP